MPGNWLFVVIFGLMAATGAVVWSAGRLIVTWPAPTTVTVVPSYRPGPRTRMPAMIPDVGTPDEARDDFRKFVDAYGSGDDELLVGRIVQTHELLCSLVDPADWMATAHRRISDGLVHRSGTAISLMSNKPHANQNGELA